MIQLIQLLKEKEQIGFQENVKVGVVMKIVTSRNGVELPYMRNWRTSFLLMQGQCGSKAFGKETSEGRQPQESANSNIDSNSASRSTHLNW